MKDYDLAHYLSHFPILFNVVIVGIYYSDFSLFWMTVVYAELISAAELCD